MKKLCLDADWRLHEAPLTDDRNALPRILELPDGWMDCELPCDVHMPLQAAGRIRDVTKADYSFDANWIERRSWWFVKEFEADAETVRADVVELTLESLDAHADVMLNGEWLGTHRSTHFPFVASVKNKLREGRNTLAVRMTTGFETVSDEQLAEINWTVYTEAERGYPERGDVRRSTLRKPQYTVGWDWGPRAVSCGIVRHADIKAYDKIAIRGAHVVTKEILPDCAKLRVTVEVDQLHVYASRDCDLKVEFSIDGKTQTFAKKDVLIPSGMNYVDMDVELRDPKLWWPAGYGRQPLHEVRISAACEGIEEIYPSLRFGVRTLALDTSRADGENRNFFFIVNGVRIFCKGGDWIPSDSVYARVSEEKYTRLIEAAVEAGFNMLRVWGGGAYERDIFYELCDAHGLLIWHDFMFACAACPDHQAWFRDLVEREMDYQTTRLRNHPSMALWCGSNENPLLLNEIENPTWGIALRYEKQYGLYATNEIAPRVIRRNCPEIPYWNSLPYGGRMPNDETCGDVHNWWECFMSSEMWKRIEPKQYDRANPRFVSEYGYVGPCCRETLEEIFDGNPVDRKSRIWALHNNAFEKDTVLAGIRKHYRDDAAELDLDDYLLYAGMVQSMMLEYSLEAFRFKDFCGGAIFWMYNDTWGEIGWTIIDYYLRRKISYFGVKRAFAPVKLTLRTADSKARLQGCNDTDADVTLRTKIGCMRLDGTCDETETVSLTIKARSRAYLGDFDLPDRDDTQWAFVALPEGDICAPAVLRQKDTRELHCVHAAPRVLNCEKSGGDWIVTLTADAFIHGVHTSCMDASDNYFDLLPGQIKRVVLHGCDACPEWHSVL